MLGWEFPPHISGGLGTACYGITKAITAQGVDVVFVLPKPIKYLYLNEQMEIRTPAKTGGGAISAGGVETAEPREIDIPGVAFHRVDAMLAPYTDARGYARQFAPRGELMISGRGWAPGSAGASTEGTVDAAPAATQLRRRVMAGGRGQYSGDLITETQRYANLAMAIARKDQFDIVHAHDWMTFPAGIAVAAAQHKPLVVHIHSTEIDRAGEKGNPKIVEIEKQGMEAAARVIAVSELTRQMIIEHYGIAPEKIEVVHNGVEITRAAAESPGAAHLRIDEQEKIVLYLGRMTAQKGPDYFVAAARKVLNVYDNVKFIMAGSGDMIYETIERAAEMGIGHKVFFTGFLEGGDVERIFRMADLYVMPSVSEPFGIAPLEAMSHDVPVIISRQSGVAEVLDHVLKVDFWDTEDLANKMLAVLRHAPLSATLRQRGSVEITQITWAEAARKIREIYEKLVAKKRSSRPAGSRPLQPPAPAARQLPGRKPPQRAAKVADDPAVKRLAVPVRRAKTTKGEGSKKKKESGKGSGTETPAVQLSATARRKGAVQREARHVEKLHVGIIKKPGKDSRPKSAKKTPEKKSVPPAGTKVRAALAKPEKPVGTIGVKKRVTKRPAPGKGPSAAKAKSDSSSSGKGSGARNTKSPLGKRPAASGKTRKATTVKERRGGGKKKPAVKSKIGSTRRPAKKGATSKRADVGKRKPRDKGRGEL